MIKYLSIFLFINIIYAEDIFIYNSSISDSLPQHKANSLELGDINNDNYLDLIISGYDETRNGIFFDVYNGTEIGSYEKSSESYIVTYPDTIAEYLGGIGGVDLSDFNRDGYLDVYQHGSSRSRILLNENGVLNELENDIGSLRILYSSAQWGDVNMDGAPDLFIMAQEESQDIIWNKLYIQNSDNSFFADPYTVFPSLFNGNSAWGDYDNDGDPDLIICGQTADPNSSVTRFYQNEPIGRLVEDTSQDLIGLKAGAFRFVDIDIDGDLDLICTGWSKLEQKLLTRVYINEPVGTYALASEQIDFGVAYGTIDAVDFNLDGYKDLVITGADSVQNNAGKIISLEGRIYKNNGDQSFALLQTIPEARIARFVDVNLDSIPDLIVNGTTDFFDGDSSYTKVLLNSNAGINKRPEAPSALTSFVVSTRVVFTWGAGSDDHHSSQGISYNLKIGTNPGGNELLSSAQPFHKTNAGHLLIREFNEIPHGTYYWSIQSVDASGQKSDWSNEKEFFITRLVPSTQSIPGVFFTASAWSDYNSDGLMDLAITGTSFDGGRATILFENDGGLLTRDLNQNLMAYFLGHLSFVDYTNDGFLDICLSGFSVENFQPFPGTTFYRWDETTNNYIYDQQDNVTNLLAALNREVGFSGGSNNHDWGDYDNDGDFDLVIAGQTYDVTVWPPEEVVTLKVFNNINGELFLDTLQTRLVPINPALVKWVDMNNDGYLDLIAIGGDTTGVLAARVYLNGPDYLLENSLGHYKGNLGVKAGAFDFGDYDSDGLIDFVLTGANTQDQPVTYIVKNFGYTIDAVDVIMDGVYFSRPSWGDYDNDGDLDLLVTGYSDVPYSVPITVLYNQNNGLFLPDTINLDSVGASSAAWADYNQDGDLDLFLAGLGPNGEVVAKVYDNLEGIVNPNIAPNPPYGLDGSSISGDQITLKWEAPVDPPNNGGGFTPQNGILYQLQVGGYTDTTNSDHQIISGHYGLDLTGKINITTKKLRNLPEGNYKWRARALDHGGAISDWTGWDYFYIDVTAPAVKTLQANYVTSRQIILVIKFQESFFLDTSKDPLVQVTHPVNPDLNDDNSPDTLTVIKQSFNVDEWTGVLLLPDDDSLRYSGKAIQVHISGAEDERKNKMEPITIYKTPESIISQYGGTAISGDGKVSVLLPQNAVNKDVQITISAISGGLSFGDSTQLITDLYTISTEPTLSLNKPGILRIAYSDSVLPDSVLPFIGRITNNSKMNPIGGTPLTIQNVPYMQVQVDTLETFGIFTTQTISPVDSLMDIESVTCQPRIFSPAGSVFEFANTNILFNLNEQEEVTARIFNLAGRLQWSLKPETTQRGSNVLNWDGKDYNGNVVASGLYIVTLEKGDSVLRTTVGVLNR
tara:strand:+ start:10449 stop:14564 length:4116 start_codon:yes stop_codon:yes gene_type:complete